MRVSKTTELPETCSSQLDSDWLFPSTIRLALQRCLLFSAAATHLCPLVVFLDGNVQSGDELPIAARVPSRVLNLRIGQPLTFRTTDQGSLAAEKLPGWWAESAGTGCGNTAGEQKHS